MAQRPLHGDAEPKVFTSVHANLVPPLLRGVMLTGHSAPQALKDTFEENNHPSWKGCELIMLGTSLFSQCSFVLAGSSRKDHAEMHSAELLCSVFPMQDWLW